MNFADALSLINYAFVLFFGVCVSFELADFPFLAHKKFYLLSLLGFGSVQASFLSASRRAQWSTGVTRCSSICRSFS